MRLSNRTGICLTVMCLAIFLAASTATLADDCDLKKPVGLEKSQAKDGQKIDSQPEAAAPSAKEAEEDPVELAKSLTNEDIEWGISDFFPALHAMLSDRAKKLEFGQGWSSRQSWEIRYLWLAGLEDPKRDDICHYLLTSVYDEDFTIGKKYFRLFEWSDVWAAWNGRVVLRTENMQPTVEAERQMLFAAWKRRIRKWEDEQFLKDRDGAAIKEAIKVFVKKINSNPVDPLVLEHARKIEAIVDRRNDLRVKPLEVLIPGIDPARNPDGYQILKAAYLAGNIKEQIRKGHGEDCPLAGVQTMLDAYYYAELIGLVEKSEVLDRWRFWHSITQEEKLKRAVDSTLISVSFPPPPPKPISKDE